jgi:hypothetical protein
MKDSNLSKMMGGYGLRDKAVLWLEQNSKDTVDREKEEMRSELAELKRIVAELSTSGNVLVDGMKDKPETLESALDEPNDLVEWADTETAVEEKPKPAPRARKSRAKPKT